MPSALVTTAQTNGVVKRKRKCDYESWSAIQSNWTPVIGREGDDRYESSHGSKENQIEFITYEWTLIYTTLFNVFGP